MSAARIALRYARAFVEALQEKEALGDAQAFLEFRNFVAGNRELQALFANVTIGSEDKAKVVGALAEKLALPPLVGNFVRVLASAGRIGLWREVGTAVAQRLDELSNSQTVELTTAVAPTEAQIAQFSASMKAVLGGSEVRVNSHVDSAIIGGAIARVGSVVYDGSVRAQLDRIRAELVKEN